MTTTEVCGKKFYLLNTITMPIQDRQQPTVKDCNSREDTQEKLSEVNYDSLSAINLTNLITSMGQDVLKEHEQDINSLIPTDKQHGA